jgi:hypothetical protein
MGREIESLQGIGRQLLEKKCWLIITWCPGARKTSFLNGPSLLSLSSITWRESNENEDLLVEPKQRRVARFFSGETSQNGNKKFQMDIKFTKVATEITNSHEMNKKCPSQGLQWYTKIDFGLKINHLKQRSSNVKWWMYVQHFYWAKLTQRMHSSTPPHPKSGNYLISFIYHSHTLKHNTPSFSFSRMWCTLSPLCFVFLLYAYFSISNEI